MHQLDPDNSDYTCHLGLDSMAFGYVRSRFSSLLHHTSLSFYTRCLKPPPSCSLFCSLFGNACESPPSTSSIPCLPTSSPAFLSSKTLPILSLCRSLQAFWRSSNLLRYHYRLLQKLSVSPFRNLGPIRYHIGETGTQIQAILRHWH